MLMIISGRKVALWRGFSEVSVFDIVPLFLVFSNKRHDRLFWQIVVSSYRAQSAHKEGKYLWNDHSVGLETVKIVSSVLVISSKFFSVLKCVKIFHYLKP